MARTEEQKKYHRESMSRYYYADKKKYQERAENWRKKNPKKRLVITNRWRVNNREKVRAHYAVADAIKNGKLRRSLYCQHCGVFVKTEAHHHRGYAKKFRLDVVWLCHPCHKRADKFLLSPPAEELAS